MLFSFIKGVCLTYTVAWSYLYNPLCSDSLVFFRYTSVHTQVTSHFNASSAAVRSHLVLPIALSHIYASIPVRSLTNVQWRNVPKRLKPAAICRNTSGLTPVIYAELIVFLCGYYSRMGYVFQCIEIVL